MLDSETKSRIDSARDILVGKVPDPKSQVEQITIALIYKFMDDMDRQSEEIGGKVTFFSGEYKKYTWSKLLDKKIGGQERLLFYAEGIEKMNENKNIPQLFRDIFKGAFLPYRDPETLNLFLKEINGFTYDHSERLGDAFEYLLSVLSSQGDAGQFRTPRHIIDFIVQIVDPKKNETVLDPACGTAGFLISSYKHIIAQNTKESPGDQLTADERGRLMTNFCGYDISSDMVRLSRVNLYLHSFANPRIHEYDTLTSEERWDERYDVILANPPFMTPKGGIRPHNRFSIKAKRSEVLFVDYIAEHLNVNGRAGVIVPEGIIFQSQNAYKTLRKMLIENYLWCVVSLPAGCFNPYSGVKTSVLLMDKSLTKRIDEILFVKIENDGFDLGAQRRPIEKNDLLEALRAIANFRLWIADLKNDGIANQKSQIENQKLKFHTVKKSRLLESGDCNLSGDRYRDTSVRVSGKWPMVKLGEVCDIYQPQTITSKEITPSGPYKVFGANGVIGYFNKYNHEDAEIAVTCRGATCGTVNFTEPKSWITGNAMVVHPKDDRVLKQYLFHLLNNADLSPTITGAAQPQITRQLLAPYEIPLPPLEVQEKIVAELDGYRKVIEGAKQVVANYKPTIRIDPEWPRVKLGDVAEIIMGQSPPGNTYNQEGRGMPLINGPVEFDKEQHGLSKVLQYTSQSTKLCKERDLLVCVRGATTGRTNIASCDACIGRGVAAIRAKNQKWINWVVSSLRDEIYRWGSGSTFANITTESLSNIEIPIPSEEEQARICSQLESERELVEANRKLIEIFKQKIQAKLVEIWGEEETGNG